MKKLVTFVKFKREQNSAWENGIAVGVDIGAIDIIIDKEGKLVAAPVWSYNVNMFEGLIWFNLGE